MSARHTPLVAGPGSTIVAEQISVPPNLPRVRSQRVQEALGINIGHMGDERDWHAALIVHGEGSGADVEYIDARVGCVVAGKGTGENGGLPLVDIGGTTGVFGVLAKEAVGRRIRLGRHVMRGQDGKDQYPHAVYAQPGSSRLRIDVGSATWMDGVPRPQLGTVVKLVGATDIVVTGGRWDAPFGGIEMAGCERVLVKGVTVDSRASEPRWEGDTGSFLLRNRHVGKERIPCRDITFEDCTFLVGRRSGPAAVYHVDAGTTGSDAGIVPTFRDCTMVVPNGVRPFDAYGGRTGFPGLRVVQA